MVHADTRDHVEVHDPDVKGREATFAVTTMTADSQVRMKDIAGFCDNAYPTLYPLSPKEVTD